MMPSKIFVKYKYNTQFNMLQHTQDMIYRIGVIPYSYEKLILH